MNSIHCEFPLCDSFVKLCVIAVSQNLTKKTQRDTEKFDMGIALKSRDLHSSILSAKLQKL